MLNTETDLNDDIHLCMETDQSISIAANAQAAWNCDLCCHQHLLSEHGLCTAGEGHRCDLLNSPKSAAAQAATKGKGKWLLESFDFQQWYNSSGSAILSLTGIPGAGKSTLVRSVKEVIECRISTIEPTVFFYLQYEGATEDPVKFILKTLADKLCAPETPVKDRFQVQRSAWLAQRKLPTTNYLALGRLFRSLLGLLVPEAECFFLVDSFDDNLDIIEVLLSSTIGGVQEPPPIRVAKFLVSLRSSWKTLDSHVDGNPTFGTGFKVDLAREATAKAELARYIDVEKTRMMHAFPESDEHIQRIISSVQERADGCFLWVKLALQSLSYHLSSASTLDTVRFDSLPLTLSETIQQHLNFALSMNRLQVVETLRWITHAARPLSVFELDSALRVSASLLPDDHGQRTFSSTSDVVEAAWLLHHVGLLELSKDRHLIFIHHTVREYLSDSDRPDFPPDMDLGHIKSHESLAITCLQFLIRRKRAENSEDDSSSALCQQDPFKKYAVDHWKTHYAIAEAQSSHLTGLLYEYLLCCFRHGKQPKNRQEQLTFCRFTLGFCAVAGFTQLCKIMLQMGTTIDSVTPLCLAVSSGHLEITRLLLENGASTTACTHSVESVLTLASQNDDMEMIQLLLSFSANTDQGYHIADHRPPDINVGNNAVSTTPSVHSDQQLPDKESSHSDDHQGTEVKHSHQDAMGSDSERFNEDLTRNFSRMQLDLEDTHKRHKSYDTLWGFFKAPKGDSQKGATQTASGKASASDLRTLCRYGMHTDG
ncbi:MAG: hypothetical protein L6R41_000600 [Letrouitia leprolyta]|nr:MAG: hypothetical protein L6R41_000600 [Letrouitia leprolyta]